MQKNDKTGAEQWLRQVVKLRAELKADYARIEKLESLQGTYQQARINKDVLQTTEHATQQIRALNMNADKADDIMDKARDVMEDMEDINRVILGPLTREPDVSEELAALEKEEIKVHQMPEPPVSVRPPTPPMVREMRAAIPA